MNSKFCIANWKTYLNNEQSCDFIKSFIKNDFKNNCKIIICPSYVSLRETSLLIGNNSFIRLGSQDVSMYPTGAYTGDISIDMLLENKCSYAIIGHSERRLYYNENNHTICKKLNVLDNSSIVPIICIGETFDEKNQGKTEIVLKKQITEIFKNTKGNINNDCIIAYEPIWAIGTGISADYKTIKSAHSFIKNIIQNITQNYRNIYLLYGGSVNEKNASNILNIDNVDGFLIGSSSINPNIFYNIYNKF